MPDVVSRASSRFLNSPRHLFIRNISVRFERAVIIVIDKCRGEIATRDCCRLEKKRYGHTVTL